MNLRTTTILTLLITLLSVHSAIGQNEITGTVFSNDNTPLFAANIALLNTSIGTTSDENGNFMLQGIPDGSHTLVISYVGFQSKRIQFNTEEIVTTDFNVVLERSFQMPQIEVIGRSPERFQRIPGSASIIDNESISRINPISTSDVFRMVPGVFIVDQDPLGLRVNIGIRGLDPSVSRNVLMMEDGIPVALAPYGEPEMYYSPAINRMESIEVLKGSGSILYGPQTFGGVINYVTADPPAFASGNLHLRGGEGGYLVGRATYGNTVGRSGYTFTYLHKGGNDVAGLNYDIHDLSSKLKFVLSGRSILGFKFGLYNEESNATYIGLSQAMFDSGNFDFVSLTESDVLNVRRYSASVSHDYFFNDDFRLRTTAFGYTTTRNWSREDFDNVPDPNRNYPRIIGNPDIDGGAIYFRGTTGNRNRAFEVAGIEPRFSLDYDFAGISNELDFGLRFLYERAFEQRINGDVTAPTTGDLRNDEIRTGYAFSAYIQNKAFLNERFSVTPGLRVEHFIHERNILRSNFEAVGQATSDEVTAIIPGIGFNYLLKEGISVYAGVHRGFGPPRTKDAISSNIQSEELDAEFSWNYEIGTRSIINDIVATEITFFFMDFRNQVIPVAEAAGGQVATANTSLVNGGETRHQGVEAALNLNFSPLMNNWGLGINTGFTYTVAEFSSDRFVSSGGDVINIKGNSLPYAPNLTFSGSLNINSPFGLLLDMNATYVGEHFTDVTNSITPSLNGRSGQIPSYFIIDASANYTLDVLNGVGISLSVKNLMDERYILSRRPQGIRVGLPRFVTFGIDYNF